MTNFKTLFCLLLAVMGNQSYAQTTAASVTPPIASRGKLILFGIEPGSIITREEYMSGKYDCISIPTQFLPSFVPKEGSDFCLKAGFVSPDTVEDNVYFRQQTPQGFGKVEIEGQRGTGRINKIVIDTYGDKTAPYAVLVEKFGPPNRDPIVAMQNGYGAKWEEIQANWTFPDGAELAYLSRGPREDGLIIGRAAALVKEERDRLNAAKANERGL